MNLMTSYPQLFNKCSICTEKNYRLETASLLFSKVKKKKHKLMHIING